MTISNNQNLIILFVRKTYSLSIYEIIFACEGLSFDYNWNSKIVFLVQIVEIGVMKMSFVDVFSRLVITFHTGTSDFNSTAVVLSRP